MNPIAFIKTAVLKIVLRILKTSVNQDVWEDVFRLSLSKMNFGNGSDFKDSGELSVLGRIKESYRAGEQLTVFDIGANVGKYACELSDFFGSQATIFSFEPSEKTFQLFLSNTKGKSNILPNNMGMGKEPSTITLYTNNDGSGLASVYQRKLDHFGLSMDKKEVINLSSVDVFCQEKGINRIHFLKLDIEGHELSALQGASTMLNNGAVDFIQFEFGGCNIDSRTYFQDFFYLLKDKYIIYRILENGLYEIVQYKEIYEVFITVNYLAIRRDLRA